MSLIALLIMLLIICVVFWAATRLMAAFGVGDPIRTVVIVILVIIVLIWLVQSLGLMGGPSLRLR